MSDIIGTISTIFLEIMMYFFSIFSVILTSKPMKMAKIDFRGRA